MALVPLPSKGRYLSGASGMYRSRSRNNQANKFRKIRVMSPSSTGLLRRSYSSRAGTYSKLRDWSILAVSKLDVIRYFAVGSWGHAVDIDRIFVLQKQGVSPPPAPPPGARRSRIKRGSFHGERVILRY
ncbi:hypothetical protein EVAR_6780_1 [Eumeta japonica]|uniref:Uncharacterized protein n=1 Tax=Eumeta variegata TaxID=151549 RepID=A0A4C1V577_EUMVA|nr:hypothetical protein EVAR_6780_1 [Eumeta japonica]